MQSAVLKPARPFGDALGARAAPRALPLDALPRRLRLGQPLFHEGDRAHHVYQLVRGVMRLARMQTDGRRQVISFAFSGDVVGFPDSDRHTTECEAITECELVAHRFPDLARPDRNPEKERFLMDAALHEIRRLQDHFLLVGRRLALERTAAFVILLLDRIAEPLGRYQVVRLAMNRTDIADYLGLTPETVSRSFTELRGRRVLALDDANTVIVLDPVRLRALAAGGMNP